VYDLGDNSDFNWILSGNGDFFLHNDLVALAAQGLYKNNNPNWQHYYNATIMTPISHRETTGEKPIVYGFLTIDSRNEGHHINLFSKVETLPIMAFGADLLALILLNLEMYDRLEGNGNGHTESPR